MSEVIEKIYNKFDPDTRCGLIKKIISFMNLQYCEFNKFDVLDGILEIMKTSPELPLIDGNMQQSYQLRLTNRGNFIIESLIIKFYKQNNKIIATIQNYGWSVRKSRVIVKDRTSFIYSLIEIITDFFPNIKRIWKYQKYSRWDSLIFRGDVIIHNLFFL